MVHLKWQDGQEKSPTYTLGQFTNRTKNPNKTFQISKPHPPFLLVFLQVHFSVYLVQQVHSLNA